MKFITKPQIKKLRVLASKAFPNDDLYHEWLATQFKDMETGKPAESTKRISSQAAHYAIQMLLPEHERKNSKYYPRGSGYSNHLSDSQAKNIGGLAADLGWTPDGLLKFIQRQTGKNKTVEMLSGKEATKVIIGLERVFKHKQSYSSNQEAI